ncbi:hypothetical protein A3K73_01180 [Candidatus Pacearchaeota archaeon RBG_13_36_9]|nr:MAG: hypothetical protein A3K73_01180 [Candidatus Pacearchaeota archaeon RBG_13_36_9]
MKIEFGDFEPSFTRLATLNPEDSDYQEISASAQFPWIELYSPLESGCLVVRRNGEAYSASFALKTRNLTAFLGLSRKLLRKIERFSPTNKDGCGYTLGENNEPVNVITEAGGGKIRIISFGMHGAQAFQPEGPEEFIGQLTRLEKIINTYVDCCYSPKQESKRAQTVPEHIIYVNP